MDLETDPTLNSTLPFQRNIFCFLGKCQVLDIKDHGLNILKSKDFIRPLKLLSTLFRKNLEVKKD